MLGGRLFLHAGPRKGLKPAYIRYLNPVVERQPAHDSEDDEDSYNSELENSPKRKTTGLSFLSF